MSIRPIHKTEVTGQDEIDCLKVGAYKLRRLNLPNKQESERATSESVPTYWETILPSRGWLKKVIGVDPEVSEFRNYLLENEAKAWSSISQDADYRAIADTLELEIEPRFSLVAELALEKVAKMGRVVAYVNCVNPEVAKGILADKRFSQKS